MRGLDVGITVGLLRDLENLGLIREVETGRWLRIQRARQHGHGESLITCTFFTVKLVKFSGRGD